MLDEPNSNLDEAGEVALVQAINALKATGSTVVLITHRPNVLAVVDHILVLKDGTQHAFGPRDRLLKALRPGPRPAAVREAGGDA
ncbi:Type I secretion system ATP-binding protein PrsD [compost metagenome]